MSSERPEGAAGIRPDATIVIVGAGQAGGWAAQTLRKEGFSGRIVLIGDEVHPPHERPPLSKAVLSGEAAPETTRLQKTEAFEALGLEWRPGVRVTRIDRAAKRLELAGGETLPYDKLILCTGGRARTLAVPGADAAAVHTLRTIDDALRLAPLLVPGRSVVVVGGGWIGLEVAATARKNGADVVVVEACSRLCERTVPREMSEHLLALHRSHGARVILGAGIAGFAARQRRPFDGHARRRPGARVRRDRRRRRHGAERRTRAATPAWNAMAACSSTRPAEPRTRTSSPPATSPRRQTPGPDAGCGSSPGKTRRSRALPPRDLPLGCRSTTNRCRGSGRTSMG